MSRRVGRRCEAANGTIKRVRLMAHQSEGSLHLQVKKGMRSNAMRKYEQHPSLFFEGGGNEMQARKTVGNNKPIPVGFRNVPGIIGEAY